MLQLLFLLQIIIRKCRRIKSAKNICKHILCYFKWFLFELGNRFFYVYENLSSCTSCLANTCKGLFIFCFNQKKTTLNLRLYGLVKASIWSLGLRNQLVCALPFCVNFFVDCFCRKLIPNWSTVSIIIWKKMFVKLRASSFFKNDWLTIWVFFKSSSLMVSWFYSSWVSPCSLSSSSSWGR